MERRMNLLGEKVLLRAYLRSADRAPHLPSFETIVKTARTRGLAGATVLQGILGYGHRAEVRDTAWSVSRHVPVIVEIVDDGQRIVEFCRGPLAQIMPSGLITLERASVMMYRRRGPRQPDEPNQLRLAAAMPPRSTVPLIEPEDGMTINQNGVLVRVFIGEADRFEGKSLYEAILLKARELGLAGATVLRGTEGFGANSVVHRASLLTMSTDLPIVIEIVDEQEKIDRLLPELEKMVHEGMITMEYVVILAYRDRVK
jgi:hypothetical protein